MSKQFKILEDNLKEIKINKDKAIKEWRDSDLKNTSAFNDMMYYSAQINLLEDLMLQFRKL